MTRSNEQRENGESWITNGLLTAYFHDQSSESHAVDPMLRGRHGHGLRQTNSRQSSVEMGCYEPRAVLETKSCKLYYIGRGRCRCSSTTGSNAETIGTRECISFVSNRFS